ncbi:ABC transporter ATP-binding protein [Candidatus Riflebacteria bacterium]
MKTTLIKLYQVLTTRDRWQFLIMVLLSTIQMSLELIGLGSIMPFVQLLVHPTNLQENPIANYFNHLFQFSNQNYHIAFLGFLLLLFFAFKSFFSVFFLYAQQRFAAVKRVLIADRLLKRYLNMCYELFLTQNSSILIKNLLFETGRVTAVINATIVLFSEVMVFSAILLFLFYMAPRTTLFLSLFFSIFTIILYFISKEAIKKFSTEVSFFQGRYQKFIHESIYSFKELKILHSQDYFQKHSLEANLETAKRSYIFATFQALPRISLESLGILGLFSLITVKILTKSDLLYIIPELSLVGMAFYRLLPSINRIITSINQIRFNQNSLVILFSEFKEKRLEISPVEDADATSKLEFNTIFKADNISFQYPQSNSLALKETSIFLRKGETIGLTGPSGSGKTTFIDILLGLLKPLEGEVILDGHPINSQNLVAFHKLIAYIPQQIFLTDDSIMSNVAFGVPESEIEQDNVKEALAMARCLDFVESLENGIHTLIGDRGVRLSGGQKQRIGIARALYRQPEILIMDEATSALDSLTESEISQEMEYLNREGGLSLIMIAHRLSTIANCDKIFVLDEGRVVGEGKHKELLHSCEMYQMLNKKLQEG